MAQVVGVGRAVVLVPHLVDPRPNGDVRLERGFRSERNHPPAVDAIVPGGEILGRTWIDEVEEGLVVGGRPELRVGDVGSYRDPRSNPRRGREAAGESRRPHITEAADGNSRSG